jgi:uncharacterized protein (TIGR02246 family)
MRFLGFVSILALAALPLAAQEGSDDASLDMLAQKYMDSWANGDAAGCASIYAEDAGLTDFMGQTVEGRSAIEQNIAQTLGTYKGSTIKIERTSTSVVSDDIVVSDGTWEVSGAETEGPTKGFYTVIAKKTGDAWSIVRNVSKVPPPMPSN